MRKLEARCGDEINHTISAAIKEAEKHGEQVVFNFNGVDVVVDSLSDPKLIYRDWERGLCGYLGENPTVGPHPKRELSAEEVASDATIEAEREKRRAEQRASSDKQKKELVLALQLALGNAGPLELSDAESWQKTVDANKDAYGRRVVRYAEEWGRLMQVRIESGETVAKCAEAMSHLADDDGITGFMYGCAVQFLATCWKHGEALRRWHNKSTRLS